MAVSSDSVGRQEDTNSQVRRATLGLGHAVAMLQVADEGLVGGPQADIWVGAVAWGGMHD